MHGEKKRTEHVPLLQTNSRKSVVLKDHQKRTNDILSFENKNERVRGNCNRINPTVKDIIQFKLQY